MKVTPHKHIDTKRFLYLITADTFSYDEYDSIAVIAGSMIEAALLIRGYFSEHQLPLHWERICACDTLKSDIVLASFNAG